MTAKQRLDLALVERELAPSREKARGMIMAGEVEVDGKIVTKPGAPAPEKAVITLRSKPRFVSRGGDKLLGALQAFPISVEGKMCADVGASTGGFTDCLLQHGASKIYALDVGYGVLDYSIRHHPSVVVMERTNVRYVETLPERIQLVVMDASFISLKLLLPVVQGWLTPQADIIPLIKPQFEVGKGDVGKGGVVKDPLLHRRVLHDILTFSQSLGLTVAGLTTSPLKGPAGNTEFLAWLRTGYPVESPLDLNLLIEQTVPIL